MVRSTQDFMVRFRPLCEWTPMDAQHYTTTEWLVSIFDTLAASRRENAGIVRACRPVVRRIVLGERELEEWLQCGNAAMALHRAQFLPLGPSAIMHRVVCPSPARDCLLIVRARGYFPLALNSYCIGEAGAQFRTQRPHSAFALGHDRRADLARIVFRPTRIVCRFGPAGSNRFSLRAGRLQSFLSSRRSHDRGLYYFCLSGRLDLVLCAIARCVCCLVA